MAHTVTIYTGNTPPSLTVKDVPAGGLFTIQESPNGTEYACIMHGNKLAYTYLDTGDTYTLVSSSNNRVGRILPETTKIHLVTK